MTVASLSELITPAGGRAGRDVELPVYSVTKHQGFVASREYFKKQVFSRDLATYKRVEPGQFAYATIHLDEGSIGIATEPCLISPMYTVFDVDSSRVHAEYLLRYMKSPQALAQYPRFGKGSVHRRKSISVAALGALEVPLPTLHEQHRIATILGLAGELRVKRQESLIQLGDLAEAVFLASLRTRNPTPVTLSEAGVDFNSGKNIVAEEADAHPHNRVIKVSAISRGRFDAREVKPLPVGYEAPELHRIRAGDILFGRASGSLDLLGATVQVPEVEGDLFLPDKVWRAILKPGAAIEKPYLLGVLQSRSFKNYVRRNASGATGVRNIGKSRVLEYEFMLPSTEDQSVYASRAVAIAAVRGAHLRHLDTLEAMWASAEARAFAGKL